MSEPVDPRPDEVMWYRAFGRYPDERIITSDRYGDEYVIGDWAWNRRHPDKPETVEPIMESWRAAKASEKEST